MSVSLTLSLLNLSIIWYGLIAVLVYIVSLFISSLLFKNILHHLKISLPYWRTFSIVTMGNLIHAIIPFEIGHFFGKTILAKLLDNVLIRRTISASAFEHFINFTTYLILFPFLLLILGERLFIATNFTKWAIIFVMVLTFGIVAHRYQWFLPKIFSIKQYIPRFIRGFFSKYGFTEKTLQEIIESFPQYFTNKRLVIYAWGTTLVNLLIFPLVLWAAIAYFGQSLSYITIFALYWVSYVIGRLSPLPAGIGLKDVTLAGFLISLGIIGETAVKIVIIYRVLSLTPIILLGIPLFLLHGKLLIKKQQHFIRTQKNKFFK